MLNNLILLFFYSNISTHCSLHYQQFSFRYFYLEKQITGETHDDIEFYSTHSSIPNIVCKSVYKGRQNPKSKMKLESHIIHSSLILHYKQSGEQEPFFFSQKLNINSYFYSHSTQMNPISMSHLMQCSSNI